MLNAGPELQGPAKVRRRIIGSQTTCDSELESLTDTLLGTAADVERTAFFDLPDQGEHAGRGDFVNGHAADGRETKSGCTWKAQGACGRESPATLCFSADFWKNPDLRGGLRKQDW